MQWIMNDTILGIKGKKKEEGKIFAVLCSEAVKYHHFEVIETAQVTVLQFCLAKLCASQKQIVMLLMWSKVINMC